MNGFVPWQEMIVYAMFLANSSVWESMHLFHTLADPTNYYGLDKIVPNYKSAFKVLVGEITGFDLILQFECREEKYRSH